MPYTPVPNSGQSLGQTRDQIRNNIGDLKASLAINHIDLDLANVGKHKFMQMPEQGSAPTTAANEGALYTKEQSSSTELFYRRESDGAELQITAANAGTPALFNTPTILTGTFTTTGSFTDIVLLPANVFGIIFFWKTTATRAVQSGTFVTDATKAYGFSNRVVTNGSSNDDPVELNNNCPALSLQGIRDDFPASTYNFRALYWGI